LEKLVKNGFNQMECMIDEKWADAFPKRNRGFLKLLDLQYPIVKRDGCVGMCFYLVDIPCIQ
jgi:hypothetical protein